MKDKTRKIGVVMMAVLLMTGPGLAVANDKDQGTPAESAGGGDKGVHDYPFEMCLVSGEEVGLMFRPRSRAMVRRGAVTVNGATANDDTD